MEETCSTLPVYIRYIIEFVIFLTIIAVSFKIVNFSTKKITKTLQSRDYDSILLRFIPLLDRIVKVLIFIMLFLVTLQYHGIPVQALVAGLGVGGVALGLAAKESIASIFGSFSLLADKAFKVGDFISLNYSISGSDVEGTVEDINLRSTKILGADTTVFIVPNNLVANCVIRNQTMRHKRRIYEFIGIEYGTSQKQVERAMEICRNIAANNRDLHNDYTVELAGLDTSALKILFCAYTIPTDWADFVRIKNDIFMEIYRQFNEENIKFAFPTQTLFIENISSTK